MPDAGAFGGVGLADQNVDAFDVEFVEAPLQFVAGFDLDFVAMLEKFEHGFLVGHVAEIGAEHGVERLGDEFFHVAETLDDVGGALVVDVNDDAEGQQRLVGVLGDEVDAA